MRYEISEYQLATMLEAATEAGVKKVLSELGLKKSQISQRETFRRFGESRVMRWRKSGKIKPVKSGGKIYYNLDDLERLQNVNDLVFRNSDPE